MSKFKVGDKVKSVTELYGSFGKEGYIKAIDLDDENMPYLVKFGEMYLWMEEEHLEVVQYDKIELVETPNPEFKVGDRVKVKVDYDYKEDGVGEDVRGLFGTVKKLCPDGIPPHCRVKFNNSGVSDWFVSYTNLEKISEEKLEPQNTETPKTEKKLERITITLKNRQSGVAFIGNYLSADAEFVYYESRDGKTYEIREDEIIMIVSEEFNDD